MGSKQDPSPALLPYWQVNVPPEERQETCPDFLQGISAQDVDIIAMPNEKYHVQTWQEAVNFVRTGRLGNFRRWPLALRAYREHLWHLTREYGSVMNFILKERLHWTDPVVPLGNKPFAFKDDFKILKNDWPYGVDKRIVHLIVWTKFDLPDDAETMAAIEAFVARTFSPGVSKSERLWFKNPPSLKSVHSVEHFHIMLLDPDAELVRKVTHDDATRSHQAVDTMNGRTS